MTRVLRLDITSILILRERRTRLLKTCKLEIRTIFNLDLKNMKDIMSLCLLQILKLRELCFEQRDSCKTQFIK